MDAAQEHLSRRAERRPARTAVAVARETLRGLLAPRRLVPILVVCAPLVVAQHQLSQPSAAASIGVAMCLSFVLVAPVSWRVLVAERPGGPWAIPRLALYAALGVVTVLLVGVALPSALGVGATFITAPPSLAICAALFLVGGWGLGRDIGFELRLAAEQARAAGLAREAERAQLLALRSHLDPHFLFNTLGAIAEWCREDGEVAERAVLELASMLRAILTGVEVVAWPLERELELVEALLSLHRLRDPGRFEVELVVEPAARAVPLPPLLLLPLAENAVKHGPAAGHRGRITLRAECLGASLRVTLENPGPYRGPRPGSSGLPVIERRLGLAYGGAASLTLEGLEGRTRATLVVPLGGPEAGGPA